MKIKEKITIQNFLYDLSPFFSVCLLKPTGFIINYIISIWKKKKLKTCTHKKR